MAFIKDQRMGRLFINLHKLAPSHGFTWREPAKSKAMHRQTRQNQRHHKRRRPWNHRHPDLGIDSSAYQRKPWVRNPWRPGIGHNSYRFSLPQECLKLFSRSLLIVLVEGELWLVNIKMLE